MEKVGIKARILVVEDESIVALDMRSRLISMGYDVSGIAASGEEALQLVAQSKPDLILMDIKLQGDLDGVDTAELVHKTADIPVIFVTASPMSERSPESKRTIAFGRYKPSLSKEREVLISIEMALYKHAWSANYVSAASGKRHHPRHFRQYRRPRSG
jgi:CheY-like chemotaxis protein